MEMLRQQLNKKRECIAKSEMGDNSNLIPKSTQGRWVKAKRQFLQKQARKQVLKDKIHDYCESKVHVLSTNESTMKIYYKDNVSH